MAESPTGSAPDLLPCPFCDNRATRLGSGLIHVAHADWCPIAAYDVVSTTDAAWNRRAGVPDREERERRLATIIAKHERGVGCCCCGFNYDRRAHNGDDVLAHAAHVAGLCAAPEETPNG